ncbi:type II secretion system protein [Candidatus Gracilibacteria bacterium]|nr:type II secretion system protein [Candidatus Gracilibacteria bacterium]
MEMKKTGFTLIELLVVIVIIGILSTISTATFKSYFGKARDAERVAAIQNMALMMKVENADVWSDGKYLLGGTDAATFITGLGSLFAANDFRIPKPGKQICYIISASSADADASGAAGDNNQFAISTWGETKSTNNANVAGVIADGTELALDGDGTNAGILSDSDLSEAIYRCEALNVVTGQGTGPANTFEGVTIVPSQGGTAVGMEATDDMTTVHVFINDAGELDTDSTS